MFFWPIEEASVFNDVALEPFASWIELHRAVYTGQKLS